MSESKTPTLTVIIPTRNRASFLDHCLRSVFEQGQPGVDVVVSDNASDDSTPEVLRAWQERGAPLRSLRQSENVGFDRNFHTVVSEATGSYLWCLGDDDWLERGGLARALGHLRDNAGAAGLTVEARGYSRDGEAIGDEVFSGAVERLLTPTEVLTHARVPHRLGNLTLNLFRRDLAHDALQRRQLHQNSCSAHHLMLWVIASGEPWVYADDPCAAWRYGNDSFMADGLYRRAHLVLTAYSDNLRAVFGEGFAGLTHWERRLLPVMAREFVLRAKNVEFATQHHRPYDCSASERRLIDADILRTLGRYPEFWTTVFPYIVAPRAAIQWARDARRAVRPLVARVRGAHS